MLKRIISSQFKKPAGLMGVFVSNLMIRGNRHNYDVLLKDLNVQAGDKILEIGYGPGIGITLLAEKGKPGIVHGIDFSKLMYKRATERNKKNIDDKKVKLFAGDFLKDNIDGADYDKIFCVNVIYFWADLQKPFFKIRSLLKNDGAFFCYMAHKDFLAKKNPANDIFNKYSIEQITAALKSAGFSKVDFYFDKGYYIKAEK